MKNHVQEKLSAYLNRELPEDERRAVAEHLAECGKCRKELDEVQFGAVLAGGLKRADAPENTWGEIKQILYANSHPQPSFLNFKGLPAIATALLAVAALAAIVYLNLVKDAPPPAAAELAKKDQSPVVWQQKDNNLPAASTDTDKIRVNSNVEIPIVSTTTNENLPAPASQINPSDTAIKPNESVKSAPFWQVEAIAGAPTAGSRTILKNGALAVGDFLETDANSRARVQVADIGQVEVAPNSRVRLVKTASTEHRLSLERGVLQARILAPPRLFIVDTPSAVAVDLGCEYTLEVDKVGNTRLHVTSGFVALETDGRESIVPAGAICLTRRGKGIGTPFFDDASTAFQAALNKFDFANGGSESLQTIIKESRGYDTLTLWHLLARVSPKEREKVFDALVSFVKLPQGVTREGVLKLNKKMLEQWRMEIESLWFE